MSVADWERESVDAELEASRRAVEERLGELREAVRQDLGWVPRTRRWIVPVVALASGLALAAALRRRRRRRLTGGAA